LELRERGYTLLELTVGLGIIVLIMSGVYATFSAGLGAYDNYRKECEAYLSARNMVKNLTRDLRATGASEPIFLGKNSGTMAALIKRSYFVFKGTAGAVEFMTYSRPVSLYWPEYFPRRSYRAKVSYAAAPALEGVEPCFQRSSSWDFATAPWKNEETEALDNISSVSFSFYDGKKQVWLDSWDTDALIKMKSKSFHNLLPQMVNFKVTGKSSGVKPVYAVLESCVNLVGYER